VELRVRNTAVTFWKERASPESAALAESKTLQREYPPNRKVVSRFTSLAVMSFTSWMHAYVFFASQNVGNVLINVLITMM
jgi:hypothetical protein